MSKTKRSWRDQIEVRESGIHGRGLFATRAIREGALVGVFEGKKTSKDDMHVLWTESEDGKWVGLRVTNLLMYVNHAADPNTEALGIEPPDPDGPSCCQKNEAPVIELLRD